MGTVSMASMVCMSITMLFCVVLPVVLLVVLKKKTGQGLFAAMIGAVCFFLFATVLEGMLHAVVLPYLRLSLWPYVAYGCLAAGVFEETARLVGLTYLCKKRNAGLATGLGYGIGHGGFEAILVGVVGMSNNLLYAVMINNGQMAALLENGLPRPQASLMYQMIDQLTGAAPGLFLVGGVERIFAVALHIALSVLIWMVVTKRLPFWFYFVSIGLHALANVSAGMYQRNLLTNLWVVEGIIGACSLAVCVLVYRLYRRTKPVPTALDAPLTQEPAREEPHEQP